MVRCSGSKFRGLKREHRLPIFARNRIQTNSNSRLDVYGRPITAGRPAGKETHRNVGFRLSAQCYTLVPFRSNSEPALPPSSRNEALMKIAVLDRRGALRHNFKVPLRVRICKSAIPEQQTNRRISRGEGSTSQRIQRCALGRQSRSS
jgi:hypothetical protein